MILDHLVVGALSLDEAQAHVEDALGVRMQPGGEHPVFHTHNAVMALEDGLYLEAIAANPNAPQPTRPRWFNLDQFAGPARLSNWVCALTDMDAGLATMPEGTGAPVALTRGALSWRMAVSDAGTTPFDCMWPAVIEWAKGTVHPAHSLRPTGVRLRQLTLSHPQAETLRHTLSQHLQDDRIAIETGPVGLHAEFDTPRGPRVL